MQTSTLGAVSLEASGQEDTTSVPLATPASLRAAASAVWLTMATMATLRFTYGTKPDQHPMQNLFPHLHIRRTSVKF